MAEATLLFPTSTLTPNRSVTGLVVFGDSSKSPGCQHARELSPFPSRSPVPAGHCPSSPARGGRGPGGAPALSCVPGRLGPAMSAPGPACGPCCGRRRGSLFYPGASAPSQA